MKNKYSDKPACVYIIINCVNGKRYIGVTARYISIRLNEHISQSKKSIHGGFLGQAIRKYGREAFVIHPLEQCATCLEALAKEQEWIAAMLPEYNGTMGGDGRLGGGPDHFTESGKERMRQSCRENPRHLGHPHSDKTKKRLREAGLVHRDEWLKRSHLGPAMQARPVICLDDGRKYPSASAAARYYGIEKSSLIELCLGQRGRKTVGRRKFSYLME